MRYISLTRNKEFARVYRVGKSQVHPHAVVYVLKNKLGYSRVGITTSKKVGNAVCRNRARRVIRAALYEVLPVNVGSKDIVIVARGKTPHLKSTLLQETLRGMLQKAGVQVNPVKSKEESE